ncbi:MAG: prepilin-type N-terminal cleavage/methylation domain-containing protein [Deltaproteobacteria bacterium]|nr:prepilin-type N-terminal cleavage/methylation domain-containing protein [Deltaproteobacteria bacterium]
MRGRPFISSPAPRGLTLIEILIAVFILGVVLTTIYAAYTGTMTVIKQLNDESRVYRMARVTLDRMSRDLTSLSRFGDVFVLQSSRTAVGHSEFGSLLTWSSSHLVFEEDEVPGAPATIFYFVKEDKNGGFSLWRSDVADSKPNTDTRSAGGVIICENLQALNLKFYDEGGGEHDTWDTASPTEFQKGKPPAAVQIELVLANAEDAEKPYRFKTRVFLPVRK